MPGTSARSIPVRLSRIPRLHLRLHPARQRLTASLAVLTVCLLVLLTGCGPDNTNPLEYTNLIGVYNGDGAYGEHASAVLTALDSLGFDAEAFDALQAQSGLDAYAVVVFSAGDPRIMVDALGFVGVQNIRVLVERGGGFLGMGAGAYLAADTLIYDGSGSAGTPPAGLYDGYASGPVTALAPVNATSMELVNITDTRFDPDLVGTISSMYRGGPEWVVANPPYIPLGSFTQTGGEAGLTLSYGFGRVALLAVQPEIEEGSNRDGTTFGDDLDDPESEWFLLRTLVEWCMREL